MGLEVEEGWPCSGPLLRVAKDVADRLLPAFDTPTGQGHHQTVIYLLSHVIGYLQYLY